MQDEELLDRMLTKRDRIEYCESRGECDGDTMHETLCKLDEFVISRSNGNTISDVNNHSTGVPLETIGSVQAYLNFEGSGRTISNVS